MIECQLMIPRPDYVNRINTAIRRSPVTALLGPRQCGKTTLAGMVARQNGGDTRFDLESDQDRARLQNPELALAATEGLVIIDEIQRMPALFNVLRVLVDREPSVRRFLILGSAAPELVRSVSESLAGRVEFVDLGGFGILETGLSSATPLWVRGGFPLSFLADSDEDSFVWRDGFVRTFLERDIPQLGFSIPSTTMKRFWTMLAHYHGQTWNASELGRSLGVTDKTVRSYLDLLTGTYMVGQLPPWHENLSKRQVKAPKVYLRDSGLLHNLLSLPDYDSLAAHPKVGASWEGFVLEQLLLILRPQTAHFWATYQGAEIDLIFGHRGRRFGIEVKYSERPRVTRSVRIAARDLALRHVWLVYPGQYSYPVEEGISVVPLAAIPQLGEQLRQLTQ